MRTDRQPSPFAGYRAQAREFRPVALRTEIPAQEQALLAGVETRVLRTMKVIAVIGSLVLWLTRGADWGLGFGVGAALSLLNFRWLKSAVNLAAEAFSPASSKAIPGNEKPPSRRRRPWSTMARFFLRYGLIGAAGYAIFLSSAISLKGFLLGLFTSVAGLMAEAAYQIIEAIFRTSRGR